MNAQITYTQPFPSYTTKPIGDIGQTSSSQIEGGLHTPSWTVKAGTYKDKSDGHCYYEVCTKAESREVGSAIILPMVGSDINGHSVSQSCANGVKTHEDWHSTIYKAYIKSVYGVYENWISNYHSNTFTKSTVGNGTQQDFDNAQKVLADFHSSYQTDSVKGHSGSYVRIGTTAGAPLQSINSDWGQDALKAVSAYKPTFRVCL